MFCGIQHHLTLKTRVEILFNIICQKIFNRLSRQNSDNARKTALYRPATKLTKSINPKFSQSVNEISTRDSKLTLNSNIVKTDYIAAFSQFQQRFQHF
jgi:hypothetical protein